jgi:nucleoporin NUP82
MTNNEVLEQRIQAAKDNQKKITERIERLKKLQSKGTNRELSDKEKAWIDEVALVESKITDKGEDAPEGNGKEPWSRYAEVMSLKEDLLEQAKELAVAEEPVASPNLKIPSEIRKAKIAQVMSLLDRETALVEGARSRLERLSMA